MSQSVVLTLLHRPSCSRRNCLCCKRLSSFWNAKNKLHHACCLCVLVKVIFAFLKGSTLLQLLLLMRLSTFYKIDLQRPANSKHQSPTKKNNYEGWRNLVGLCKAWFQILERYLTENYFFQMCFRQIWFVSLSHSFLTGCPLRMISWL